MTENRRVVERHGCIVCGKTYDLLVVYHPDGKLLDWTVTSPGGHRVPEAQRPLVACDTHPPDKIQAAYAKRYAGRQPKEDEDD